MKVLVIGYGDPSRGDDGIGHWVVERIGSSGAIEAEPAWPFPSDLISKVAAADLVIFVDADVRPGPVRWRRLYPSPKPGAFSHIPSPEEVLAWVAAVEGRVPEAWLVAIPGEDFSPGTAISPRARRAAEKLIRFIERLSGPGE